MEEIVRKYFKKLKRIDKIQEIIANVKAVISDHVKPSFLFDICGCDRITLSAFVSETNSQCLIIMEIESRYFFLDKSSTLCLTRFMGCKDC